EAVADPDGTVFSQNGRNGVDVRQIEHRQDPDLAFVDLPERILRVEYLDSHPGRRKKYLIASGVALTQKLAHAVLAINATTVDAKAGGKAFVQIRTVDLAPICLHPTRLNDERISRKLTGMMFDKL